MSYAFQSHNFGSCSVVHLDGTNIWAHDIVLSMHCAQIKVIKILCTFTRQEVPLIPHWQEPTKYTSGIRKILMSDCKKFE